MLVFFRTCGFRNAHFQIEGPGTRGAQGLLAQQRFCHRSSSSRKGDHRRQARPRPVKQRIPRKNEGRSGGIRSLLFYRKGRLAVFVHLFAKNAVDNISAEQLHALASIAKELGKLTASQISQLTQTGLWEEIDDSD